MSLMPLLSAGKSLIGLKDSASRYRMGDPRAMPKFSSRKNPFRLGENPVPAPAFNVADAVNLQATAVAEPPPNSGSVSSAPSAAPANTCTDVRHSPLKNFFRALTRAPGALVDGLLAASSRVPRFWRRQSPRPIPQFPKSAVQGELSLDAVRVVRNDLSDTDVELVPAKASPTPSPGQPKVASVEVTKPRSPDAELATAGRS
jgi:hypothetical protein